MKATLQGSLAVFSIPILQPCPFFRHINDMEADMVLEADQRPAVIVRLKQRLQVESSTEHRTVQCSTKPNSDNYCFICVICRPQTKLPTSPY